MNKKLTAVLQIMMFYVSYLGPFVLKASPEKRNPAKLGRNLVSEAMLDFFEVISVIATLAFLAWGVVLLIYGGWIGFLVLGAALAALYVGSKISDYNTRHFGHKRHIKIRYRIRSLSKVSTDSNIKPSVLPSTSTDKLTEEQEKLLLAKIEKHTNKLNQKFQIDKKTNQANSSTLSDWMKKRLKNLNLMKKFPNILPLSKEEMAKATRALYAQEFLDIKQMIVELERLIEKHKNDPKVQFDECRKERRRGMKLRIERSVDLIMTNVYREERQKKSFDYKYKIYKSELDPLIKQREEAKDDNTKKGIDAKIQEIIKRPEPGKTEDQENKERQVEIARLYNRSGVKEQQMNTYFFTSYSRAFVITLMKFEKIYFMKRTNDTPMTVEEKRQIFVAIEKIDEQINKLLTTVDLD